jgi:hypothetical protein
VTELYHLLREERCGVPSGMRNAPSGMHRFMVRCGMHQLDPREVILAAFGMLDAETCDKWFHLPHPPVSFLFRSPQMLELYQAWKEQREALHVEHEDETSATAFRAAVDETEHRLELLTTRGVPRDEAVQAGVLAGFLRPEWLLAYLDAYPVDLRDYNPTDKAVLSRLTWRYEKSATFRQMVRQAR